jgi:hypothetical protein
MRITFNTQYFKDILTAINEKIEAFDALGDTASADQLREVLRLSSGLGVSSITFDRDDALALGLI